MKILERDSQDLDKLLDILIEKDEAFNKAPIESQIAGNLEYFIKSFPEKLKSINVVSLTNIFQNTECSLKDQDLAYKFISDAINTSGNQFCCLLQTLDGRYMSKECLDDALLKKSKHLNFIPKIPDNFLNDLKDKIDNFDKKYNELLDEKNQSGTNNNQLSEEQKLQIDNILLEFEKNHLKILDDHIKSKFDELTTHQKDIDTKIDEISNKQIKIEQNISKLNTNFSDTNQTIFDLLNDKIPNIETQISNRVNTQTTAVHDDIDSKIKTALSPYINAQTSMKNDIESLKNSKQRDIDPTLIKLVNDVNSIKSTLSNLIADQSSIDNSINNLKIEHQNLTTQVKLINQSLSSTINNNSTKESGKSNTSTSNKDEKSSNKNTESSKPTLDSSNNQKTEKSTPNSDNSTEKKAQQDNNNKNDNNSNNNNSNNKNNNNSNNKNDNNSNNNVPSFVNQLRINSSNSNSTSSNSSAVSTHSPKPTPPLISSSSSNNNSNTGKTSMADRKGMFQNDAKSNLRSSNSIAGSSNHPDSSNRSKERYSKSVSSLNIIRSADTDVIKDLNDLVSQSVKLHKEVIVYLSNRLNYLKHNKYTNLLVSIRDKNPALKFGLSFYNTKSISNIGNIHMFDFFEINYSDDQEESLKRETFTKMMKNNDEIRVECVRIPYLKTITKDFFKNFINLKEITFSLSSTSDNNHPQRNLKQGVLEIIEDSAFENCNKIKHIELPSTLKKIGKYAFSGCSSLKSVGLKPDGPLIIESFAFYNCENLTELKISMQTDIKDNAFQGCKNLKILYVPQNYKLSGNRYWSSLSIDDSIIQKY